MTPLFLQYPACSTCQKAKKWLIENNIEYTTGSLWKITLQWKS